ncbi:hypothetical protein ACJX0J_042519, partial [Zea mays]
HIYDYLGTWLTNWRRLVRGGHERLQRPQGAEQGEHARGAQDRRLLLRQGRGVAQPRGEEAAWRG